MIKHVGLTIKDPSEIKNFYQEILGLNLEKEFTLTKELNQQLFGFYEEVPVSRLSNGTDVFEIFITKLPSRNNYSHLCIEVDDREAMIEKVKKKNYPYTIIERETEPLVFIQDKFGNNFEILVH
ncbi:MAG: VOC family protein [Candidatus Celaenobacter antarcticus]|nr:VOC family protein [Candidatus Celaenobacter antarcticus]